MIFLIYFSLWHLVQMLWVARLCVRCSAVLAKSKTFVSSLKPSVFACTSAVFVCVFCCACVSVCVCENKCKKQSRSSSNNDEYAYLRKWVMVNWPFNIVTSKANLWFFFAFFFSSSPSSASLLFWSSLFFLFNFMFQYQLSDRDSAKEIKTEEKHKSCFRLPGNVGFKLTSPAVLAFIYGH